MCFFFVRNSNSGWDCLCNFFTKNHWEKHETNSPSVPSPFTTGFSLELVFIHSFHRLSLFGSLRKERMKTLPIYLTFLINRSKAAALSIVSLDSRLFLSFLQILFLSFTFFSRRAKIIIAQFHILISGISILILTIVWRYFFSLLWRHSLCHFPQFGWLVGWLILRN